MPSAEALAAEFIAAIRQVQPEGPYFIGGHCFGSLLAWEGAWQMAAQDMEVGCLILLDPIVSDRFIDNTLGRSRILYHWLKLRQAPIRELASHPFQKVRNPRRTVIARQRVGRSFEMAKTLHGRYKLEGYGGLVTVILPDDSYFSLAPEQESRRH